MKQNRREAAPAGPVDKALIERWALAYLDRFPSSAENLRRVLSRRVRRRMAPEKPGTAEASIIVGIVDHHRETGLIDDVVYATSRAKSRLRRGQSLNRVRAGLASKGVAAGDVAAAIAGLSGDTADGADPDLAAACAFAGRRRLGPFRAGPQDAARELSAFARAGFTRPVAEKVLGCTDPAAVAALLQDTQGAG
jgi:regulatory protein